MDFGENIPMLLRFKWIQPSIIQFDEYGFEYAHTWYFLLEIDETYVSPLQINQSFLIEGFRSLGWSYVIQVGPSSKQKIHGSW